MRSTARCEAAFRFYERCLGGRIVGIFTFGNSPLAGEAPPEWGDKVMHATLAVGDTTIAGADVPPGRYEQPQGFSVLLGVDDPGEAERIFSRVGGKRQGDDADPRRRSGVFGSAHSSIQFGIPWSINCEPIVGVAGLIPRCVGDGR